MRRRLILNADDFGWDKDASAGILELVHSERITNVSVMANFAGEEELYALQKYTASISTGLHITLNAGYPLFNTTFNSLVNETGKFHTSKDLFKKALLGKIRYSDLFHEIKAQHRRMLDAGLAISHADSHQHMHQYPILGSMILRALKELGVKRVRNCSPLNIYDKRRIVLKTFCALTHSKLKAFHHPDILVTDFTNKHFDFSGKTDSFFEAIVKSKYQTVEWMCHPALRDRNDSYLQRKKEFDFLKAFDWNALLAKHGFEMAQYKNI